MAKIPVYSYSERDLLKSVSATVTIEITPDWRTKLGLWIAKHGLALAGVGDFEFVRPSEMK